MKQNIYGENMACVEQLQNSVVVDGSYPSRNENSLQEWTPILKNSGEDIKHDHLDNITNVVQTFEIPKTSQLRYGGDLELKLGYKVEGFLELLQKGAIIGDGSYSEIRDISLLQELVLEHPDKLNEFYSNFMEAGSDVLQALTVCSSIKDDSDNFEVKRLNEMACKIVCKLATEHGTLVAGAICPSADYMKGMDKDKVQTYFKQQLEHFNDCKVDLFLCDMFAVEETEWALEVMRTRSVPVVVTLCVDRLGTVSGTSLGDYAVKMAKAGADVVGVCCKFEGQLPEVITEYVEIMRAALDREGLKCYIMSCPHATILPSNHHHSHAKKECFESKPLEKSEVEIHARALYDAGVRFFRAGCGLGTTYIQHISNELMKERAKTPININTSGDISIDKYQPIRKGSKTYWNTVISPSASFTLPESA